ncbi:MAG: hypothetical protein ACJ8J0_25415 [Longimicrobiaceae bacterium]
MSVRQIGGSPDDSISSEYTERPRSRADEGLVVNAKEGDKVLTPFDPVLDEVTRIYHRGAGRYRNALRELAK